MKKLVALVLSLCLVLAAVPALAAELLSGADTYPMDCADKTITWYVQDNLQPHESYADWHESPFHLNMSKQLGVNVEWVFPTTGADTGTFTNTLVADPQHMPNIMITYWSEQAAQYLDDGLIWDLTPYIQEYAPAYYAFLQTNPAYDKAMKTDDGRYYAFNFFREDGGWNDTYLGPVVRTDWLEECGLEMPKTISEFENVIRVFNEKYGAVFGGSWGRMNFSPMIAGAFGAYANHHETWYVKDGKVGLGNTTDEYRAYLSWLNKLYDEGLLDPDFLSEDDTSIKAKIHNDKIGITFTAMSQVTAWNNERAADGKEEVWVGLAYPKMDDGNLSAINGGFGISNRTGVITKCTDEETMKLCLRAMDYAYTQEGFLFWNYGVEGESWVWGDNGVPVWTDLVNNDTDLNPTQKYSGQTMGCHGIQATNLLYLKNSAVAVEANNIWFYAYPDDMEKTLAVTGGWQWPTGTTFTTEEQDELDMIATSLGTYCGESFANFVLGVVDVNDDAVWAEHLKTFEKHNLSRITEIRQGCYDRYLTR